MTEINTVVALVCFENWCAQQVESYGHSEI
jgi:hypothetical protein